MATFALPQRNCPPTTEERAERAGTPAPIFIRQVMAADARADTVGDGVSAEVAVPIAEALRVDVAAGLSDISAEAVAPNRLGDEDGENEKDDDAV